MTNTEQDELYVHFIDELLAQNFSGEACCDLATRVLFSSDNSIYQWVPSAVCFPKNQQDIEIIFKIISTDQRYPLIEVVARGGGTSTIGQALNAGLVVDCRRFFNRVIDFKPSEKQIIVQPGITADEVNCLVAEAGLCFPVKISSGYAATIGGMVNTNAAGQGSYCYGRMHQHVVRLSGVTVAGEAFAVKSVPLSRLVSDTEIDGLPVQRYRELRQMSETVQSWPQANQTVRAMSSYNILDCLGSDESMSLVPLFCGAEGTLAIITQVVLSLVDLPAFEQTVVVALPSFQLTLRYAERLLQVEPVALEVIDQHVLSFMQQQDSIVALQQQADKAGWGQIGGLLMARFVADSPLLLRSQVDEFCGLLPGCYDQLVVHVCQSAAEAELFWRLRESGVAAVGQLRQGKRVPVPFIEDTVVPIAYLSEYVSWLCDLLDQHALVYGMYGHLDAGCIHFRPALDLASKEDLNIFKEILDLVSSKVMSMGGLLRGEHGFGFCSQYQEQVLDPSKYALMQQIKSLFDPLMRLNPRKVSLPVGSDQRLLSPLAAWADRGVWQQIASQYPQWSQILSCNGNAKCLSVAKTQLMCPSYQITNDQFHSPRGRSVLLRDWLSRRQMGDASSTTLLPALFESLSGCLGCKACQHACPQQVSIPAAKHCFLAEEARGFAWTLRRWFFSTVERWPLLAAPQGWVRCLLSNGIYKKINSKFGYGFVPRLASSSARAAVNRLLRCDRDSTASVGILVDWFSGFYHVPVLQALLGILRRLSIPVEIITYQSLGMMAYQLGDRVRFEACRASLQAELSARTDLRELLVIEPSVLSFLHDEYAWHRGVGDVTLGSAADFLVNHLSNLDRSLSSALCQTDHWLLSHCHESALDLPLGAEWQACYAALGLSLTIKQVGCCGMAGQYGMQSRHQAASMGLYQRHWQPWIARAKEESAVLLATGFSCREQIARLSGVEVCHPLVVLWSYIGEQDELR